MVNQSVAITWIKNLLRALAAQGYRPTQAWLFGSVAQGKQHQHSDVDLALWDDRFSGCLSLDYEPIKHILTSFPRIELHTFHSSENESSNPLISEIKKTGMLLNLTSLLKEEEVPA